MLTDSGDLVSINIKGVPRKLRDRYVEICNYYGHSMSSRLKECIELDIKWHQSIKSPIIAGSSVCTRTDKIACLINLSFALPKVIDLFISLCLSDPEKINQYPRWLWIHEITDELYKWRSLVINAAYEYDQEKKWIDIEYSDKNKKKLQKIAVTNLLNKVKVEFSSIELFRVIINGSNRVALVGNEEQARFFCKLPDLEDSIN